MTYSRSTFRLGGRLDGPSRGLVQALYEAVSQQARAVAVSSEDYEVPEAGPATVAPVQDDNALPF